MDKISSFRILVDDQRMPYLAAHTVKSEVGVDIYVPDSVIIYDFKNESYEKYPVGQTPSWVEIDVDIETSMAMLNDWGTYRKGFWKSLFNTFATKLTDYESGHGNDMFFVNTANGQAWFSGMTSANKVNESIVNLAFVDTKTGKTILIPANGSDENGIVEAVQSKLGVDSQKWQALMPIKYLIVNKFDVWILPIIDKNTSLVQKFGIVDGQNINRIAIGETLDQAINNFMKKGGFEEQLIEGKEKELLSGVIDVFNIVGLKDTIYAYIKLVDSQKPIECNTNIVKECLIMKEGMAVDLELFDKDGMKSVSKVIKF